jgi:hypothetical protein
VIYQQDLFTLDHLICRYFMTDNVAQQMNILNIVDLKFRGSNPA